MKYYTGVGARKTPKEVLEIMTLTARWLEAKGWILRSGGAQGADTAFEQGIFSNRKHIFRANHATEEAMEIAKKFHPAWEKMTPYAQKLHGRNAFQVLGLDLETPSKMLICWTPDGCISHQERTISTGGTGTAISIASAYHIPVFNLQREEHRDRILQAIRER